MSHLAQTKLARSKQRNDKARSSYDSNMKTASILIVEDEPSIIDSLALSLERENYQVMIAEDGLSACRLIGEKEPDLIILDILLPDFNGWEICHMLRQHPIQRIATTPVIMLTALTSPEDKIRGLELGADLFLPKPFSIRELQLLSAKLIERRQHTIFLEQNLQKITRQQEERINFTHLLLHELRNQLFVIDGYTQLLPSGHKTDNYKDSILRISEYFFRAEPFAKQIRGSGLGLHGVKVLSRAMGGNVTLENIKGEGNCFQVSLPLTPHKS